jgi:hypothetical protein
MKENEAPAAEDLFSSGHQRPIIGGRRKRAIPPIVAHENI